MSNVKGNIIYSIILTVSTYIVNFIIFPYITRVLGAEEFGTIGFATQTVSFFILFAMLGIGTLGIREIAACGDDAERRSRVFSSLLIFSLITTVIVSVAYIFAISAIDKMRENSTLMIIGLSRLIFNTILVEWFFRGIERFKYISLCSIIIKTVYIIAVFLLVKEKSDADIYYALTCAVVVVNAIVNILYARRFVRFSFKGIELRRYFKPLMQIGSYSIITAAYTTFNVIYLGLVNTDTEVGYYYAATRIYAIILNMYTAFTNVMFPRASLLLAKNDMNSHRNAIRLSFEILFVFALPIIAVCTIMGGDIILLLSGDDFVDAITPFKMIIGLILIVGIAQIIVMQVLIPRHEDSTLLRASVIGAVVGTATNILLVRDYGAIGSAVVLLCSECAVFGYYIYYVLRHKLLQIPFDIIGKQCLAAIPYFAICYACSVMGTGLLIKTFVCATVCGLYFLFVQIYVFKYSAIKSLLKLE